MENKNLGDWCKWLEKNFSPDIMIPTLPVIVRLDGNNFSKWTKTLNKPFDIRFNDLMISTTEFLVKETNAVIGYTQSDEITLILYTRDRDSSIYNDGKKQKMLSKITGLCVGYFNQKLKEYMPEQEKVANFDCRIYQTPTLEDACSQLLWRENDATRNSILMLASSEFSFNETFKLNTSQLQDKLMLERNINWNNLPLKLKRGTYVRRTKVLRKFDIEELKKLNKNHAALKNPDLVIERSVVGIANMPIFNKITNRVGVVFNSEEPILNKGL